MKVFLDSSSFAKRFIKEKGSDTVDRILTRASAMGLCIICLPEIISALNRKVREKSLSNYEYSLAKDRLSHEVSDTEIIQLTPEVIGRATSLLEGCSLRGMDALHVSSAIEWDADIFVSSDKDQIKAARKAGLKCELV